MTSPDSPDKVKDQIDQHQDENFPKVIFNADDFLIKNAPSTIRYIPNFIDEELEEYLLWQVENAPKPKWEFLKNRRLQNWGGIVGKKALIADNNMPDWLNLLIDKIMDVENGFPEDNRPNHVLVNEYLPGQGIMPHTDGPAFFPMVSTVSLGSHTFLDFYDPIDEKNVKPQEERYVGSMLLQPRSLILIKDDAYEKKLHGIEERKTDLVSDRVFNKPSGVGTGIEMERGTRISLTIRNVPKVNIFGLMLVTVVGGQSSTTMPPPTGSTGVTGTGSTGATGSTGTGGSCTDSANNCVTNSNLCNDALYYDVMTTNCASTCGRCNPATQAPGTCADRATNCANYLSKCQSPSYQQALSENCAQTCGFCSGSGTCQDSSSSCAAWKNNGFCTSTFYSPDYKRTTCGVTCGLC